VHVLGAHVPAAEQAYSTVDAGQSASVVHGLAAQCPPGSQVSSPPQPAAAVHAGMQVPVLPVDEQVHGADGPQTMAVDEPPSPGLAQSASVEHGSAGGEQMAQPVSTPPGLQISPDAQSACERQGVSLALPSAAHSMLLWRMAHAPSWHTAVLLHP
jgi:hypothetical protein